MKVLIYNTQTEAETRNHEEALSRGCNTEKTLYWWSMIEGENGQWALKCGGDPLQDGESTSDIDEDWVKTVEL